MAKLVAACNERVLLTQYKNNVVQNTVFVVITVMRTNGRYGAGASKCRKNVR